MYSVTWKSSNIAMAHRQQGHAGQCKFLHGHTWHFAVVIEARSVDALGHVLDFAAIARAAQPFLAAWDHAVILDATDPMVHVLMAENQKVITQFRASAEELAGALAMGILSQLKQTIQEERKRGLRLAAVTCYEGKHAATIHLPPEGQ